MSASLTNHDPIFTLHRYYCWTTVMKHNYEKALLDPENLPKEDENILVLPFKWMAGEIGMYQSYWYGGLYVVCEGWKEIGLSDTEIDGLLATDNIDLLRRYRNGIFHFQKNYFDPRVTNFEVKETTAQWTRKLSSSLGRWFLDWLKKRK